MTGKQIFLDKSERVMAISESEVFNDVGSVSGNGKKPAIVEIAGRDSVAAAVKSVRTDGFTDLLPVYAYTGTEYGPWAAVETAVARLRKILPDVRIYPLMIVGSPGFWRALNGRFISELIQRFGFFSPCPGCHLYLHAVRIPLAVHFNGIPIIAGERESHSGVLKINQSPSALDFYREFAARFDAELKFPLRYIDSGKEIEELLNIPWQRGKDQLQCVLSGNYRGMDENIAVTASDVSNFFEEFAGPAAEQIVQSYIAGEEPDHNAAARSVLRRI